MVDLIYKWRCKGLTAPFGALIISLSFTRWEMSLLPIFGCWTYAFLEVLFPEYRLYHCSQGCH